jgi:isoleucyl-tRNA synthetase
MANNASSYNYKEIEEGVIKFWEDNKVYPNIKAKGKGKKKFFFIQGPPYTSGRIHLGQAWNNSAKDMVLRYKRMNGFDVFDRAAYDMHGLPTERKVMELHKLKNKEDIEKFGIENFSRECLKWCLEGAKGMDRDLWRLGVWMDFPNACYPINPEYTEGVWFLVKKAHEKGRLYEGLKTMSWCANCQTAMAKHECEYKEVKENSVFVKFPVKGKEKEFLIIWTTTPWTIAYNLAIMAGPEIEYVKAKVGDEVWILAKSLAAPVIQMFTQHKLEILEEFPGTQLEGLEYVHPWNKKWDHYKEIKAKHPKAHTVILSSEYVDTSAGSGLVHCAPGCGPEDYEVGLKNNIPAFNNLKENGVFPESMAEFAGLKAKKDDSKFVEAMKKDGILIATTEVEHDYAHCQRCHEPVIFRTTKQWFFKVEDLKERMVEANEGTYWVPEAAKNAFRSWLENLRDNSITKQRYWGTPVPIWKCPTCGKYEVIGSIKELEEKAGHLPENLHKPWIDSVEINCKCGDMMKRVPDVLDVWIDAGTLSWNVLDYPQRKDLYEHYYPADFIIEGKDQIRGWFNMLTVTSFLALDRPAFKNCYMHGFVTDVEGEKMSKSLGNIISPFEVIDKYGADTLRLYTINTRAAEDMNFSWDEVQLRNRNLSVLWNTHKYLLELAKLHKMEPKDINKMSKRFTLVERYILSKTHSAVKKATELFESYNIQDMPALVTDLFLELSRTYIQMNRDKSNSDDEEEREVVFNTIHHCLLETVKILSPVCPFIAEQIYKNMREQFNGKHGLDKESVHDLDWPKHDEKLIDKALEEQFDLVKTVLQSILSAREKAELGVRWPVKEVVVVTGSEDAKKAVKALEETILTQTNTKKITVLEEFDKIKMAVKPDSTKIGPAFGEKAPSVIAKIATTSPQAILARLEKEGKYNLEVNGDKLELTKEHFIIKREVPDTHAEGEFRQGYIYLDKTRTPELDAEGFARELMRRVQAMRKEAGLVKSDSISLFMQTDQATCEMLKKWNEAIRDRVGAKQMNIAFNEPAKMHQHKKKIKVKDKEFMVEFDKV